MTHRSGTGAEKELVGLKWGGLGTANRIEAPQSPGGQGQEGGRWQPLALLMERLEWVRAQVTSKMGSGDVDRGGWGVAARCG